MICYQAINRTDPQNLLSTTLDVPLHQPHLVDSLGCCIPGLWIGICGSSKGHCDNLTLDVQFESLAEFYYQGPRVRVASVRDQGQKAVQVVVYCLVSLIVRGPFQGIDYICFCIDWKELTLELPFKVGPGLNGKKASVCFLAKEVFRPPCSPSILEKSKSPEDFFLVATELLWGQMQIQHIGVEESSTGTSFTREVWGRGEFQPCSLFRQSGQDQGRWTNRRRRYGYWRQSNGRSGRRAGHELSKLLQLGYQAHKSSIDSVFQSVLAFSELLEMVLQIAQGVSYSWGGVRRE